MKKKIGIVVQRYGIQINGGAEVLARMLAEKLNLNYDVTVLTSRAINYHTWEPELPAGESIENGVRVIRFEHPTRGNPAEVHQLNRKLRGRLWYQKLYRFLGKPTWYLKLVPDSEFKDNRYDEEYLSLQGPYLYDLKQYLLSEKENYTAFVFVTYLYYPSAVCMPFVAEKSIFIPTLHDEPSAHMAMFQRIIPAASWIFFLTKAEMEFSVKTYDLSKNKIDVVGVGMEMPESGLDETVLKKFDLHDQYVIYVGRIDKAKGCETLLDYFIKYIGETKRKTKLVMVGKNMIEEIKHPQIMYTGFVSDHEKSQLMKQATLLIMPSQYESLSFVVLESFLNKVPVLANRACEVLKDHIEISNGGFSYTDYESFSKHLNNMLDNKEETKKMAENGFEYVLSNFTWETVLKKFDQAIDEINERNTLI